MGTEEKDALPSSMLLVPANDIECLLGDSGRDDTLGDADDDLLGGEPGGVSRGVLVWDAINRPCGIGDLETA